MHVHQKASKQMRPHPEITKNKGTAIFKVYVVHILGPMDAPSLRGL
jgi:hypothetical protein